MFHNLNNIDNRKIQLLKYSVIILSTVMLIFSIFNFYRNEVLIYSIEFILFIIGIISSIFIIKKKFINQIIIILLSLSYIFTIFIFPQKKFNYSLFIWALTIIGLTFYFINIKYASFIVSLYLIITISILFSIFIEKDTIPIAGFLNITSFIISFTAFIFYYELTRKESEDDLLQEIQKRKEIEEENKKLILELKNKINEVNQLSSFLPICSSCKKIRNDNGYWEQIENYITQHSDTQFSHSLCPICAQKLYPEFSKDEETKDL